MDESTLTFLFLGYISRTIFSQYETYMKRDIQTVTKEGFVLDTLLEGVKIKKCFTHIDDRGSVCEMMDERWDFSDKPLVYSYFFTTRPGISKGWGMHKINEDRYFLISGEIELVLYDDRPSSSTYKKVCKLYLSEYDRKLVNIPPYVWHAHKNIGLKDSIGINFPTEPYHHENPDKYRVPINDDRIPYKFKNTYGW